MAELNDDPIRCILNLISATIQWSSYEERPDLERAASIFERCTEKALYLDSIVAQELEDQMEWIRLYHSHQVRYPTHKTRLNESLLPVAHDNSALLSRFACEVLDGASTVAEMLHVELPVAWTCVDRTPSRRVIAKAEDHTVGCEAPESKPQLPDETIELNADAIEFAFAYF